MLSIFLDIRRKGAEPLEEIKLKCKRVKKNNEKE